MTRYLLLPLILLLTLVALLVYVGNNPWVEFSLLANEADTEPSKAVSISLQAAIVGAVVFMAAIIILWSVGVWFWRLPSRMKTGFGRQRANNGLDALEDALLAGEAGNGERARRKAKRAHELLERPALSGLVSAKAAEAAGEIVEASGHYTALLDDTKTEAVGLRGLARLAANKGDHQTTIEMAKAAYAPSKGPKWAFEKLFKSQVAINDWDGALDSLASAEKRKHIEKPAAQRRKAVLLSAKAAQCEKSGNIQAAIDTALRAIDTSAGFAPAVALAARLLNKNGQAKKAASLIEKAWGQTPHPALAISYSDIFETEPAKVRDKKMKALIKANPAHRESMILNAEEALHGTNDDIAGVDALQALGDLLEGEPSARLCALASAAEEKLGNTIDARAWHFRAASAPVEADWSDLDPNGPAFNYTQTDWQRLVMSYGETSTLIHPRHETFQRRRAVVAAPSGERPPVNTPSLEPEANVEDLSQRLENLLDGEDKE